MPPRLPFRLPGLSCQGRLLASSSSSSPSSLPASSTATTIFKATIASQTTPLHSDAAGILSVGQPPASSSYYSPGTGYQRVGGGRPPQDVQAAALRDASAARRAATADRTVEFADKLTAAAQEKRNSGYVRMMTRRWQTGDVYAPHDLSEAEMRKGKRTRRSPDMVDLYGIKPMDMYRNFNFLAFFMTPGGQIQHSNMTQLRPVNQRKVARAIRRAIGLGLMPSVHRHPEILKHEFQMESNHRAFQVMQKTRVYF